MTRACRFRRLLAAAAVASVVAPLALASWSPASAAAPMIRRTAVAPTTATPIKNFVFLFQENHTFDNYFGTRPGVDGIPAGVCQPVEPGRSTPCVQPFHIGDKGSTDLPHTDAAFEAQYDGGKMDGFVSATTRKGRDGSYAMGYYDDRDLPYYWNIADEYVLFDRFFSSARGGSVRNHMYVVAGSPGATGASESIPAKGWGALPTIFDRLESSGVSWKFYVQNYNPAITYRNRAPGDTDRGAQAIWVPLLSYARYIDDPRLSKHIVDISEYYDDAARGTLPAVSYIAPSGNSEHPPGSVQAGQTLTRTLITELQRSPQWSSSAFMWSYDDWGGYYDHVRPPSVDRYGYGFRVPALLVSPYAKRGHVEHATLDFTSVLKFIEHNWSVTPLSSRDAAAGNFLDAFDFSAPRAPVLLSTQRNPVTPVRPHTPVVYTSYAVSFGFVVLLVATAALSGRRWASRGPRPRTADAGGGRR